MRPIGDYELANYEQIRGGARWHGGLRRHVVKSARHDAFLAEIDAVCRRHGISLAHEDMHGGFEMVPYSDEMREWLNAAAIYDEDTIRDDDEPEEQA